VCHKAECDGSGTCGHRVNRFTNGALTANNVSYAYSNVNFATCTGCHASFSPFSEAWSESSDFSVFDTYCGGWSSSYYGSRRAGCVLNLVLDGTMPAGSPGGWSYQDEYLQWYCSSSGPGGGVFGF
jgi:hypothetical protein